VQSVEVKTNVCGMFSYSEMTIEFKDTLSTGVSDSLELTCEFNLPQDAVVDSMVLWINNEPVPAYLLDKWKAWQVYTSIVRTRQDPAYLIVSGNRYTLRIFPFKSREARKVKINFSAPLVPSWGNLELRLPVDFTMASCTAPEKISWEVAYSEQYDYSDIEFVPQNGMIVGNKELKGMNVFTASIVNSKLNCIVCKLKNANFKENGYVTEVTKDNTNEMYFSALLDVSKLINVNNVRSKKVLFVWNCVQSQFVQTVRVDHSDDTSYESHVDYTLTNGYFPDMVENEAFRKFVAANLQPGDSFNIILNDGEIKSFNSSNLVNATSKTVSEAANFINSAPSKESSAGSLTFSDLLEKAIGGGQLRDSMTIVIIDKTSFDCNLLFNKDTTVVFNYSNRVYTSHYSYPKTLSNTDALVQQLYSKLTPAVVVYALTYPDLRCCNYIVYDKLTRVTNGMVIPMNYQEYGFNELSQLMMGRLYPANLSITACGNAYTYDVNGLSSYNVPIYKPLFFVGKIHGITDSIRISIKGTFNGNDYNFDKSVSTLKACNLPAQRQIWAAKTVMEYAKENSLVSQQKATQLSFKHHILTDYSTLLAFEHGFDSLLSKEEVNRGSEASISDFKKSTILQSSELQLNVTTLKRNVQFKITGFSQLKNKNISLKIYDLKGRLVMDVSKITNIATGSFTLPVKTFSNGTYIVKLTSGKKAICRIITIRS
jgi:hypothetical protein